MEKIHKNNPDTLMYQDYTEGKKHLTFWEEDCEFSTAKEWFNHTVAYKKYLRKHISENGYKSVLDCGAGIGTEYIGLLEDKVKVELDKTFCESAVLQIALCIAPPAS